MTTQPQTVMPLEGTIRELKDAAQIAQNLVDRQTFARDSIPVIRAALHHLEAQSKECECDGRTFDSPLDAALHLLWLLQRLSFYEPEREGQPCDGARFRQGIIEARKLLNSLDYEKALLKTVDNQPA